MPIKAALTIGAKGAGKVAKATDQEALVEAAKAADRAAAGRRAADVAKATEPMKISEALGNLNVEGKGKLKVTQSDRTRVGGGNIGGAMFSGLQQVDPFYEGLVWGVGEKGTASKMIGQSDPFTFWSTILGAEDQLKSNPLVFNKLRKGFTDAMKEGKLTKELEKKINHNLALTFGEGAEIRDPKIWQKADTFEKRAALADIMLGKGIPPSKGGVALGGEKSGKGVIFRPTDILKQETEPLLLHPEHGGDVPTFAVGPRLFNLEGNVVHRPDLHPGFPYLLTGEDTGMVFKPGEAEKIMRDYAQRLKDQGKARIGYYEWTLGEKGKGLPTQDINEEYLTYLQKQGMAEGGPVEDQDLSLEGVIAAGEKDREGITDEALFYLNQELREKISQLRAGQIGGSELQKFFPNYSSFEIERMFGFTDTESAKNPEITNPSSKREEFERTIDISNALNRELAEDQSRGLWYPNLASRKRRGEIFAQGGSVGSPEGIPSMVSDLEAQYQAYKAGGAVQMRDGGTPITDEISGMLPALDPNQESYGSPTFEATKFIASQIPKALVSPFVGAYKTVTSGKFGTQEGIKAGEKAMEEFMLPSGELSPEAAEKVGQFGKFMEELETKYKLPPIMPEVFGPVTGSLTGMGPQARSIAGKAGTAVKEAVSEVPPLPVGLSIEPVGKPIAEVIKPGKVKVPATDLGFYSPIEKALENSPRKAGPGQAFINDIMKFSPSSGELEGTGIIDWLKTQKNVTKQDVLDYLSGNKIEIQETVRGTILTPDERLRLNDINRLISKGEYVPLEEEKWFEATKARLQEFKEPKYESENLILPGGKNYREIVLSLPEVKNAPIDSGKSAATMLFEREMMEKYGGQDFPSVYQKLTPNEIDKYDMYVREDINSRKTESILQDKRNNFQSSHFPEKNILAHMRTQDMNIGGKKTLVVEEIQSDWHQEGREKGYKPNDLQNMKLPKNYSVKQDASSNENPYAVFDEQGNPLTAGFHKDKESALNEFFSNKFKNAVPNAPFKKDWYQLAIKRLMKYAADNDYDQIALVGPEEQIRRGSLGTYVDGLTFEKNKDGSIKLLAEKGESVVLDKTVKPEDLELYVGKNVAKKILSTEDVDGTLTGDDLMIGGEGMRQYYGRSYPDSINRIGKKYNANIEKRDHILKEFDSKDVETIPTGEADRFGREMMAYGVKDPETDEYISFEYDFEKALSEANKKAPRTSMWFMDLPANLKSDVKIGQPYKKGGAVKMQRGGPIIAPFNTVPDVTDAGNLINFSLQQELKRYA
jgi:hypothetical protein